MPLCFAGTDIRRTSYVRYGIQGFAACMVPEYRPPYTLENSLYTMVTMRTPDTKFATLVMTDLYKRNLHSMTNTFFYFEGHGKISYKRRWLYSYIIEHLRLLYWHEILNIILLFFFYILSFMQCIMLQQLHDRTLPVYRAIIILLDYQTVRILHGNIVSCFIQQSPCLFRNIDIMSNSTSSTLVYL